MRVNKKAFQFIIALLSTHFLAIAGFSQSSIFSENMGSIAVGTNTAINSYGGFQNSSPVSYTGTGQVSSASQSDNTGASGGNNIFLTSNAASTFNISNINISGASNLQLNFGIFKNLQAQTGSDLNISIAVGSTTSNYSLTNLPTGSGSQGWYSRTIGLNGVSGSTLNITFTSNAAGANNWLRLDDISLISSSPLPVTFGYVQAQIKNSRLFVEWQTEQEINNDHFEIETSKDGVVFTKIAEIKSNAIDGNSDHSLSYSFNIDLSSLMSITGFAIIPFCLLMFAKGKKRIYGVGLLCLISVIIFTASCNKNDDNIISKPGETIFIRIAQVDKDGSKKYSKIVQALKS